MDISVIGGTGDEGFGLTLRLARAGNRSYDRLADRGEGFGRRGHGPEMLGAGANVGGAANEEAATADVVIVTVPFGGQAEIYRSIKDHVKADAIVVDCTSPLATAVGGRAWRVVRPWHGSAAEQAKAILEQVHPVRMVGAFHTISGEALQNLEHEMESDVLVCGTDTEAKAVVGGLVDQIPNLRWVDAGDLTQARTLEPLTALLISINRSYKIREAGFRSPDATRGGSRRVVRRRARAALTSVCPSRHRVDDQPTEPRAPHGDGHGCRHLDVPWSHRHDDPAQQTEHDDRLLQERPAHWLRGRRGMHAQDQDVVETPRSQVKAGILLRRRCTRARRGRRAPWSASSVGSTGRRRIRIPHTPHPRASTSTG